MKLILISSMVMIIGFCTYQVFVGNGEDKVQLTDYATELQRFAESKNKVEHRANDSFTNAPYDGANSFSASRQNVSLLTSRSNSLLQPSEHASGNVIGGASDYASNHMSPEGETLQDDSDLDAMQVQVSEAPSPEADYIATESISGLPIPSEEPLQSTSKADMR